MVAYILSILILWFLIVVIMISDSKSRANQWLAATLFVASFTGIGDIFIDLSKSVSTEKTELLTAIGTLFLFTSCGFYYTFVNFTFYSSKLLTQNKFWEKYFPILTLLPTIAVFASIKELNLHYENSMLSLIIWKNVYSVIGYVFLIGALFAKKNHKEKLYHFKVFLFVVPSVMFIHILNDYAFLLDCYEIHRNNFWIVVYVLAVYIFLLTKEGFMGMKIKIEKSRMQGSVETLNMAAVFLTHNFKNEIVKITEFTKKIKEEINCSDNEEFNKWFSHIDDSKAKLNNMLERIRSTHNENIVINKNKYSINELIAKSLDQLTYGEKERNLIELDIDDKLIVLCDLDYTAKAVTNLIDNAYEAVKGNGKIKIHTFKLKQVCVIEIKDNGVGISKEDMEHIMKPFFSTKTNGSNMGLGLTYCYNIITMSGGEIHIQSEVEKGTTVSVYIGSV